MKITNKYLREWFPDDDRFLHYCAKYYGLTFMNQDTVDLARHIAVANITRLLHSDREFESEGEMIGVVMMAFKYAILNSYKRLESFNQKNLSVYNEAELTRGSEEDSYVYNNAMSSNDVPYDNTMEDLLEYVRANASVLEYTVLDKCMIGGYGYTELANELGISPRKVELAKGRVITKLKRYINAKRKHEEKSEHTDYSRRESVQGTRMGVQVSLQPKPIEEVKREEVRYSEAMSFLYSS